MAPSLRRRRIREIIRLVSHPCFLAVRGRFTGIRTRRQAPFGMDSLDARDAAECSLSFMASRCQQQPRNGVGFWGVMLRGHFATVHMLPVRSRLMVDDRFPDRVRKFRFWCCD
jgi:hypothetical protein